MSSKTRGRQVAYGTRKGQRLIEQGVARANRLSEQIAQAAAVQERILAARQRVADARLRTLEAEGKLLERMVLNQELAQKLEGSRTTKPSRAGKPKRSDPTGLDWEITDEQVEALALKALLRFRQLPTTDVKRSWAAWKRQLGVRLPANVAVEVARRAQELWDRSS